MRVHHLNCGTMAPPVVGRIVCHVLLCELPDRLVLVDTGFGLADVADPARRLGAARRLLRARLDPDETAIRQVEALGHRAADVRDIVVTHFDLDHIGGLADFPAATVHVMETELATATRPPLRERNRYRSSQWAHGPKLVTYTPDGEPWQGFPAARPLDGLGDGFALVPLVGHTRGHAAVAVDAGEHGWVVHAGDAYFHRSAVGDRTDYDRRAALGLTAFEFAMAHDPRRLRGNHAALAELAAEHTVFSAHDPVELDWHARANATGISETGAS